MQTFRASETLSLLIAAGLGVFVQQGYITQQGAQLLSMAAISLAGAAVHHIIHKFAHGQTPFLPSK